MSSFLPLVFFHFWVISNACLCNFSIAAPQRSVPGAYFAKLPEEQGLKCDVALTLFVRKSLIAAQVVAIRFWRLPTVHILPGTLTCKRNSSTFTMAVTSLLFEESLSWMTRKSHAYCDAIYSLKYHFYIFEDLYVAGVYSWDSELIVLQLTKGSAQPIPSSSNQLKDSNSRIFVFVDKLGACIDIHEFDTSLYIRIKTWTGFDLITDVQHPLDTFDPAHSKHIHASFRHHVFECSCGLISLKASPNVTKPSNKFDLLKREEETWGLRNVSKVKVKDGKYHLTVMQSLPSPPTTCSIGSLTSSKCVTPIGKDEKLLVSRKIIMISAHNNSISAISGCNTSFIDHVQFVINYSPVLELKYKGSFPALLAWELYPASSRVR